GTLAFNGLASFNANDMDLVADSISFTHNVSGTGSLTIQPFSAGTNMAVGGGGTPIVGLNLTAADLADLPLSALSTLNLYAAGNAIDLDNAANSFGAVGLNGTPSAVILTNSQNITQLGTTGWNLGSADLTANAGVHDIILTNSGNTFGTVSLTGANAQLDEAADTDIGASSLTGNLAVDSTGAINMSGALAVTGNVSLTATGEVTQSAPLTIGGNLDVVTTVNAGDVAIDNS